MIYRKLNTNEMSNDESACNKLNYKKFANMLLPSKIFVTLDFIYHVLVLDVLHYCKGW